MNNHLTPEKRLNKNGVLVTKHVKNGAPDVSQKGPGLFSRLFPGSAAQNARKQMIASVSTAVEDAFTDMTAKKEKQNAAWRNLVVGKVRHLEVLEQEVRESDQNTKTAAMRSLTKYSDDTLEIISETASHPGFHESLAFRALYKHHADETLLRESIAYADTVGDKFPEVILSSVRDSLGSLDLSEHHDKEGVSAVLRVAMGIQKMGEITPELARVTTLYPDRTEDIVNYVKDRGDNHISDVDAGGLEEYLSIPARSLSEGAL